jgi:hypothetical protein
MLKKVETFQGFHIQPVRVLYFFVFLVVEIMENLWKWVFVVLLGF